MSDSAVKDAEDRLACAERRLHLARIDRDLACRSLQRAKENVDDALQSLGEALAVRGRTDER